MKKTTFLIIMLIILLLQNCTTSTIETYKIEKIHISFKLLSNGKTSEINHIYFDCPDNKSFSLGVTYTDSDELQNVNLYPGRYDIYCYTIDKKGTDTYAIYKINQFKNNNFTSDSQFFYKTYPINLKFKVPTSNESDLSIPFENLYDIFTLNSISIQEDDERYKSQEIQYNDILNEYTINEADIDIKNIENYRYNASLSVKSKIDKDQLEQLGYRLSTTYIADTQFNIID